MARYDYRCTACGEVFEVEHSMTERPEVTCPSCGGAAEKVFSASGIKFEGSGFYNTDQRASSSCASATGSCGCRTKPPQLRLNWGRARIATFESNQKIVSRGDAPG